MARCGCASSTCACLIEGGNGVLVSGTGNTGSPIVLDLDCAAVLACVGGGGGGGGLDLTAQRRAMGAVSFTWDDGWDTHPGVADMHAARDQRATFYITSNLLGTAQHMAAAAMAPMVAQGHEIGCHSADHIDMTTLTPVTRAAQWNSAATLEGIIGSGYRVRSYAFPYGNTNLACNSEGYGRFERLATIGLAQGYYTGASGYGPWQYEDDYEGFRHGRFPWSPTTHGQFMQLLDVVRRRPFVLSAYAHQIGNSDTPTMLQVTEALDFCQANGIPCITAAGALAGPKIANPGFESGLDGWTVTTAGNAATGATIDTVADAPAAGLPGTQSLRVISPSTTTSGDSIHIFQTIPVRPNRAYSLSAQLRHLATPVGAGRFSVRINEYSELGASIAGRSLRGAVGSGLAWTQSVAAPAADAANYIVAGKTHPDTRYMTVGLYLQDQTGTYYADHVYFGPTEEGLLG